MLLGNDSGQLLLVATSHRVALVLPGGVVEDDESPAAAAEREVLEESGLRVTVRRLLVVEHLPAQGRKPSGLRFVFDAAAVRDDVALTPQPEEVTELVWLSREQAILRHTARGRRRLVAALQAHDDGSTVYLDTPRTLSSGSGC